MESEKSLIIGVDKDVPLILLLSGAAFVFLSWSILPMGSFLGVGALIIGFLLIFLALIELNPKFSYLRLDENGIEFNSFFFRKRVEWKNVDRISRTTSSDEPCVTIHQNLWEGAQYTFSDKYKIKTPQLIELLDAKLLEFRNGAAKLPEP